MMRLSSYSRARAARSDDRDATARSWVLRLASGEATAADAADLRKWMALDRRHRAAFERARALWHEVDAVEPAFRRDAPRSEIFRKGVVSKRVLALAAAVTAILLAPMIAQIWAIATANYRSPGGQITTIELPDGSKAWLDSGAALNVHFTDQRRDVDLLKGRVYFAVSHDPNRAFVVTAGGGTATAVGTEYSVATTASGVTVAVEEGQVRISAGDTEESLSAGQESGWSKEELFATTSSDVQNLNAWRRGRIIIQNETLADAIAQLDRYHPGLIIVRDARDVRVSGQFDVHGTQRGLDALAESQGLRVSHWGSLLTILSR